jgi:hypothetical protein
VHARGWDGELFQEISKTSLDPALVLIQNERNVEFVEDEQVVLARTNRLFSFGVGVDFCDRRSVGQTASSSWCRAALWGPWPDFTCSSVSHLLASSCRAPSPTRGRVCILQCTSLTGQSREGPVSCLRLPQPGGLSPPIYIPQRQGGPVIPPGNGFHFRRPLQHSLLQTCNLTSLHTGIKFVAGRVIFSLPATTDSLFDTTRTI